MSVAISITKSDEPNSSDKVLNSGNILPIQTTPVKTSGVRSSNKKTRINPSLENKLCGGSSGNTVAPRRTIIESSKIEQLEDFVNIDDIVSENEELNDEDEDADENEINTILQNNLNEDEDEDDNELDINEVDDDEYDEENTDHDKLG